MQKRVYRVQRLFILFCKGCLFKKKNDIVMIFPMFFPRARLNGTNSIEILEDNLLQIVMKIPGCKFTICW